METVATLWLHEVSRTCLDRIMDVSEQKELHEVFKKIAVENF